MRKSKFLKDKKKPIFLRALLVFFESSPSLSIVSVILMLIIGIIPSLMVSLSRLIVQSLGESASIIWLGKSWGPESLGLLWAVLFILSGILSAVQSLVVYQLSNMLIFYLQTNLMRSLSQYLGISLLESPEFYDEIAILKGQSETRAVNLVYNLTLVGRNAITIVSMLFVLSKIDIFVPLLLLLGAILPLLVGRHINNQEWEATYNTTSDKRRMNYYFQVFLEKDSLKEIQLYNLHGMFIKLYKIHAKKYYDYFVRIKKSGIWKRILVNIAGGLMIVLAILRIISLSKGIINIADMVVFLQVYLQLQVNMGDFIDMLGYQQQILQFYETYFNFINKSMKNNMKEKVKVDNRSVNKLISSLQAPIIECKNLYFRYDQSKPYDLSNVSFSIYPNQTLAIVGKNGSGKSTLIKVLLGFYPLEGGAILIEGKNVVNFTLAERWRYFSAVFQDFPKYKTNIAHNIGLSDIAVKGDKKMHQLCDLLGVKFSGDGVRVEEIALGKDFGGNELSGGEWQKIALARACYQERPILILDEPTASLDPIVEAELYQNFHQISAGRTCILITHRLGATTFSDQILLLEGGKVQELGNHKELMEAGGQYSEMFLNQASYYKQ